MVNAQFSTTGQQPRLDGGSPAAAANFDNQAATKGAADHKAPNSSTQTELMNIDIATNFDEHMNTTAHVTDDSSGGHADNGRQTTQGNNVGDDDSSHFSDVAQAIAAQATAEAMESLDMDKLCSELFTEEMLEEVLHTGEGLEAPGDLGVGEGAIGGGDMSKPLNVGGGAVLAGTGEELNGELN